MKRIKEKTITFKWEKNQYGIGEHCVYFPFMKLYIYYDVHDVNRTIKTKNTEEGTITRSHISEEIAGWKFMAYFCDNSYTSRRVYQKPENAKFDAERYCYHVLKKLLERVEMEGCYEYTPLQQQTGEEHSKEPEREEATK